MDIGRDAKDTTVGRLPSDWDVKRLGDLGSVVRGGSPRPAGDPRYFGGSFIPWLTVAALTNIPDAQPVVSETVGCLTERGAQHSRRLSRGTLIIANSGATLGVAKLLGVDCCANDGIAAVVDPVAGHKEFLAYFVNSQTRRLREVVASGNGQPNLNVKLIREIEVPFPRIEEQMTIAAALGEVDALICSLGRLIAKKRDLKQAAMQQLLTGQIRLPGFRGEWKSWRLGDLGRFSKGRGIKKDDVTADGLPCIRYGEIYTRHTDYIRAFSSFIPRRVAEHSQRLLDGALLFAGSGETAEEIGKCVAFLGGVEAYAGGDIVLFNPVGQDSMYFGYLMNHQSVSAQKARMAQGDLIVHIGARHLAELRVMVPAVAEQCAIATVIADMDTELDALVRRLSKTRDLKQGMMQELLTGKTRLV